MGKAWKKLGMTGILLVILCLMACGSRNEDASVSSGKAAYNGELKSEAAQMNDGGVQTEEAVDMELETGSQVQTRDTDRKLIQYLDVTLQTREFDKFISSLEQLVQESQGYVEFSEVSGNQYRSYGEENRYASYTLRIPVNAAENFRNKLQEMGTVTRQSERVEDVTLNYVDTESHIRALKAEQESLMKMLEEADTVETILAIQNQLTQVRYQLESYESQIRTYDNAIEYSTVTLYLYEVERESSTSSSYGGQLMERLSKSLHGIKNGFLSFSLWFLGGFPYWVLLAAVVLFFWFLYKKIQKKGVGRRSKGKRKKRWEIIKIQDGSETVKEEGTEEEEDGKIR